MIQVSDKKLQLKIEEVYAKQQEHIFRFWDRLNNQQRQHLLTQVEMIDFTLLSQLAERALQGEQKIGYPQLEPPGVISLEQRREKDPAARETGEQALAEKKVAAFLVAGGQGTRLNFDGPKGMYPVTPVRKKSLFQLHAEKLLSIGLQHDVQIPLYIMTSLTNHEKTKKFFEQNTWFGYSEKNISMFTQEMIPAVDRRGKLILDRPDHIFMNPNGHGGSISALWKSGALADMKARGIEHVFYFQVDNVLTRICDPVYLGYHILGASEMSCKVVKKKYSEEKMGVLCKVKNRLRLIEYSDMSREDMIAKNADGSLKLWAGNIATHLFKRRFLERENENGFRLPFHLAEKNIPFLDEKGDLIRPKEKNGIKFETFVFDALVDAQRIVCLEVDRAQEFSPLKNKAGENSPQTVKLDLLRLYSTWLSAAGHDLAALNDRIPVEISPLLSLQGENLDAENMTTEKTENGIYIDRK